VWSEKLPADDDPLRQGDLLVGITVPDLRLPVPFFAIGQQTATTTPAKVSNAIVISQCCDNEKNDYVVVAPVGRLGNLKKHQLRALLNPEPVWDGDSLTEYALEDFHVESREGLLDDPGEDRYLVAKLHRSATFHGDCSVLIQNRRARMTVVARRLLRIKLGLLGGRPEAGDVEELERLGIPPGLSDPTDASDD